MTTKVTPRRIEATATRQGAWWFIEIPELGTVTQARKVREIEHMATDLAALWLDVDPSRVQVNTTVHVPSAARMSWERAQEIEARARVEQKEAAVLRRQAVQALRAEGITLAEAAQLLHVSPQRVHQLAH